jgi:thioredoxin 1
MSAIIHANDASFDQVVLQANKPVLVDFWAPWCGPCKMIGPILEQIQSTYMDKLLVVKINVDDHKEVATQFNVRGIPTLLLFKEGQLLDTHVGMASLQDLKVFVDKHI